MINVLSYVLFALAVITCFLGVELFRKEGLSAIENRLYFGFAICSTVWSFSWSMLVAQTDIDVAHTWRSVGMIGLFGFFTIGTFLLIHYSEVKGLLRKYIIVTVLLGFLIYPTNIRWEVLDFYTTWFGMTYKIEPDFWTNANTIYTLLVALNMGFMLIYMIKYSTRQYQRVLARKLFFCEVGLLCGMILDLILPLLGIGAFPGSSMCQAMTAFMMYSAVLFSNKSRISFTNFSEYICYSTESPILIVDYEGRLKIANESASKFFNLTDEQLSDMYLSQLYDLENGPIPENINSMTVESVCKLNQTYCSLFFTKVNDDYGDLLGYTVVVTDLTDKQKMIQQLAEERDRANKANEAKSSFLANMSHEIRTPINAILGMDELLLRESLTGAQKKYAQNIKSAGNSLLSIINAVLDFSKIESGKMELAENSYQVASMINDIKNVMSVKAEDKGLNFRIQLAPDTPSILWGDGVRVRQIITNLLNNAVKYTEKGEVLLDVTSKLLEEANSSTEKYINLIIKVKDTGIGIKKENISILFDAFQRLDSQKTHSIEGTGLGLSIVKRFAELMNGTIEVDSVYGEGSTFVFTLKQKVMDATPVGDFECFDEETVEEEKQLQRIAPEAKVLCVDDNRVNLSVLKGLLKRTKVQTDAVLSGAECIQKVQENSYHVIFLDHMMPGMDGVETLEKIKQLDNNLSEEAFIVALTANAVLGAEEMYMSHGFHGYLSKPINSGKLENMLFDNIPQELVKTE